MLYFVLFCHKINQINLLLPIIKELKSLIKYFKDDDEQAKEIAQFLLESREEKVKESIRRKVQK